MAFGELLLSAFLQVALDRLIPREFKEFARCVQVDSDLEELEETMLMIQGVLHDAEQKQITNPVVRLWLDKLTHLALDIEDLLDEIATHAHRLKQEEETQPNTNQVRELVSSLRDFWLKSKQSGKIKTLIERLDKVWLQGQRLGLSQGVALAQSSIGLIQRPPTTPLPLDSHVYGREKDVEQLLKLLLLDGDATGSDNVSVIPIVGMGGVGKTTLAQLLYNHEDVKKHFTLKAWACVSDAKFDVVRVTKEILESATKDSFTVNGLQQLQERLKEVLGEKKFLLVLDDVWSEDYNDWDRLRAPFRGGPNGSKIIVTTRSENVSSIMRTVPTFHLKELSEEDCQALFFHHAFQNSSPDKYSELKSIGEKIVKKCKGLPLAAKTLGGLLRCRRDTAEWEGLLSSEIWDQTENTSGVLPSLALSYHYLPAQLKRCFSYCAMFPQDYVFNKEKLILLWMAEGFLQLKGNRRMEDTGDEYFRELLSRSFFQQISDHESGFVMHDLIHDLARSVCREICFSLRDEQKDNNSSKIDMSLIRYAFVAEKRHHVMSKFKVFQETKSLRALLLMHSGEWFRRPHVPRQLLCFLFPVLPCLRVLRLSGVTSNFELPESVGDLMHLRHIDLSQTSIKRLPNSLCELGNLQTLLLSKCMLLIELPSELSNLIELRHLRIDGCQSLEKMPVGMNKLTNLQTLPLFVVGENSGSSIRGLKDIKQLREKLCIVGLRNVDQIDDSLLGNKKHLHELELSWESTRSNIGNRVSEPLDEGKETTILKELQPHTNLKRLSINGYHGTTFSSWLGSSSYSQLVNLELLGCRRCQLLPSLGCLPLLRYLLIQGLEGVKSVGAEFYGSVHASKLPFQSLETLIFRDMEYWEEWFGIEEEHEEVFPSLCELEISNCPKLRKFSHRFVKLKELKIRNCHELIELPRCLPALCKLEVEGCEAMVLRSEVDSTLPLPLSFLSLSRISNLKNLLVPHRGGEGRSLLGCLNALRELKIEGCNDLVKLLCSNNVRPGPRCLASLLSLKISWCSRLVYLSDDEDMLPLSSVTRLEISSCPCLHFLNFPSQVETVCIRSCLSLKNIQMMSCTSLRELTIHNLPGLPSSGEKMVLPSTIRKLEIYECENLKTFPELMVHSNNNDNNLFLDTLRISDCGSLTSFTERGASSSTELPLLPKSLVIIGCENLVSLPERMMYSNRFLERFVIQGCNELTLFPSGRFLGSIDHRIVVDGNMNGSSSNQDQNRKIFGLHTTVTNVKTIEIHPRLNSLPHCMYNLTSLQYLSISGCPSLVSFSDGRLPTSLTSLYFRYCTNLRSLPDGLHNATSLRYLAIRKCPNLKSLPDGLHNATSLRHLSIKGCPNLDPFPKGGFPGNLHSLEILNCVKQKSISEWGIHNLTSLKSLTIGGFSGLVFFPESLLPPNLTFLEVKNLPDLHSPPEGLHSLTSLEQLLIIDCKNLAGLPERGLPSSLGCLQIIGCPILGQQCEDWPKIAEIPDSNIY